MRAHRSPVSKPFTVGRAFAVLAGAVTLACDGATDPGEVRRIAELAAVTAGPDRLVAVGATFWATDAIVPASDTAFIVSSADGLSWETAVTPAAGTLLGVAQGDGRYVAVGSRFVNDVGQASFTPVVYQSDDGRTWQAVPDSSGRSWGAVVWGAGTFVAVGVDAATLSSVIATSPDGATWTDRAVANIASARVTFGAGTFVLWGEAGAVAVSSDAIDWTVTPVDSVDRITGMIYEGGRFLASGLHDCCFGEIAGAAAYFDLSSPGGTSWTVTRRTAPEASFWGYAFGGGRFVALSARTVFTSSDGATWEEAREFPEHHSGIAYLNGRFVVVGRAIRVSADGEDWTEVELPVPDAP